MIKIILNKYNRHYEVRIWIKVGLWSCMTAILFQNEEFQNNILTTGRNGLNRPC